jgi:hypothetical protein
VKPATLLLNLALLLAPLTLGGCATHADYLRQVRQDFYMGRPEAAAAAIDKRLKSPTNDGDVLKLERAVVDLSLGKPHDAEVKLRQVRDRFDDLERTRLGQSALRMITDDNAASYGGEDYEKILIRAFLAIAGLMGDGGDAAAYSLQVDDKQNQIIQAGTDPSGKNPKLSYKQIALGAYIHGVLAEESFTNFDDAVRSYTKVVNWEHDFLPGPADVQRATYGCHTARGNGALYVFSLVGRGPYKEQVSEMASTVSLLIADRILSATSKHSLPPTIAPIKVPKVVLAINNIRTVTVNVDGQALGNTQTVTHVGRMAAEQYAAVYPEVIARAIVRRIVKKGIIYAGKDAIGGQNPWMELGLDAAGVAWEAAEAADTRCWGLLPDQIQVLRVELPAGDHLVDLRPAGGYGSMGAGHAQKVTIRDAHNTYMLANFPDQYLVGQILVSQH